MRGAATRTARSQQHYDAAMLQLADRWLSLGPPPASHAFLRCRFQDLQRLYGRVYGLRVSRPKLLPITAEEAHRILAQEDGSAMSTPARLLTVPLRADTVEIVASDGAPCDASPLLREWRNWQTR